MILLKMVRQKEKNVNVLLKDISVINIKMKAQKMHKNC